MTTESLTTANFNRRRDDTLAMVLWPLKAVEK